MAFIIQRSSLIEHPDRDNWLDTITHETQEAAKRDLELVSKCFPVHAFRIVQVVSPRMDNCDG